MCIVYILHCNRAPFIFLYITYDVFGLKTFFCLCTVFIIDNLEFV